ncbi:MAG TPA: hypothetical protein VHJ19_11385 [Gammaproteobacteria bacterium]|nr:hypothetical protein [Gammaproteobacteria bacterium]
MHPTNQILTTYRLEQSEYDKSDIRTTTGSTPVGAIDGLQIDWAFMVE